MNNQLSNVAKRNSRNERTIATNFRYNTHYRCVVSSSVLCPRLLDGFKKFGVNFKEQPPRGNSKLNIIELFSFSASYYRCHILHDASWSLHISL